MTAPSVLAPRTVLFAGGGTGGHIYPNVAIDERLRDLAPSLSSHFLVSDRAGDARTMEALARPWSASTVRPLPPLRRPWRAFGFYVSWRRAIAQAIALLQREKIGVVVATGGFVSGPALVAARELRIPRAMVNLDAVPGIANRRLHRECTIVFTAYESPQLAGAKLVGLPLRRASLLAGDRAEARARLGVDPARPLLFVTGATHGAESLIRTMMALVAVPEHARRLADWQVLHQCGGFDVATVQRAYDDAGVRAKVVDYLSNMGDAWGSADLALSRAGAGSVAEAWGNATPTIFAPNPYHSDGHQRLNAEPLRAAGGAMIVTDQIDPAKNLDELGRALVELLADSARRDMMRTRLERSRPPDGATTVAKWIIDTIALSSTNRE